MAIGVQGGRSLREQKAYDEGDVFETSKRWQRRFRHVLRCPNAVRQEEDLGVLLRQYVPGAEVLDIGCGGGGDAEKLLAFGPRHVLGVDISKRFIEAAQKRAVAGKLTFRVEDVSKQIEGRFDLIVGRSILHHLGYQEVLQRLCQQNLKPGGIMIFTEPLGENLLSRFYHRLVPASQTDDERPFLRRDLRWLNAAFKTDVLPYCYLSYPGGILSSLFFIDPDNALTRLCDRVDHWLAGHAIFLTSRFRTATFLVQPRTSP